MEKDIFSLYGDGIGGVALIQSMGDDLTIVNAARASLGKESTEMGEREQRLSNFLIRSGHTSTMEHNYATFWIKVPLFVARQQMRHRTFSYNEISRRYTSFDIEFYEPKALRLQDTKNRQASLDEVTNPEMVDGLFADQTISRHVSDSMTLYDELIEKGISREHARMVLPQNIYTTYWATGSLHNWVNSFIAKRDHPDAQYEIRLLAQGISTLLRGLWPIAHENLVKHGKIPAL